MSIDAIGRQQVTLSASAAATVGPEVTQVICNATSAGFTLTLTDFNDGAKHQLEVLMSPSDSSGNDVTISGNAGAFTTTVSSDGSTSVLLETQYNGTWFVVADVSTGSAAAANSRAVSAGLAASGSTSVATSQNGSQSQNVSSTQSIATSAVLSGVSATASIATSQNASQSLNVSSAMSLASS
jgi:hypothetical protein